MTDFCRQFNYYENAEGDGFITSAQNEKNNRNYELQKSADGKSFRRIAQFAAAANSTQAGSYRYSNRYKRPITTNP
jgi:hypothetical protein